MGLFVIASLAAPGAVFGEAVTNAVKKPLRRRSTLKSCSLERIAGDGAEKCRSARCFASPFPSFALERGPRTGDVGGGGC
jgi:hypothetical protein